MVPDEAAVKRRTCEVLGVNGIRQVLIGRDLADPVRNLQEDK